MAVEHMVWIRFFETVEPDQIAQHLDDLRSLADSVPGIRSLRIGENFTDRAWGCTHGMIVTVDDRAALRAYSEHPEHVKVATRLKQDAELMAMDIET